MIRGVEQIRCKKVTTDVYVDIHVPWGCVMDFYRWTKLIFCEKLKKSVVIGLQNASRIIFVEQIRFNLVEQICNI